MKIVHVPFCFYPDPVGGTEVYVEALAHCLQKLDVQVLVAAPGQQDMAYTHNRLMVRRFAVSENAVDLQDLYGEGDTEAALAFGRILDEEHPNLVHLHAFTSGVSLRLAREAKRRGIPIVFTYHTPTVSCQRGTLMRWGREACDGKLRLNTCTTCTLQGLGLPRGAADVIGHTPLAFGKRLGQIPLSGGMWTALRMRELISLRHAAFKQFMAEVDHIVALCRWTQDLLLRNGVPLGKIALCRQGLAQEAAGAPNDRQSQTRNPKLPVRLVFLGRLNPTKGVHILIRAIQTDLRLPVTLDLDGILQYPADIEYSRQLIAWAKNDPRIVFHPSIAPSETVQCLRHYDLVIVPSQWLETGPMVVLEAFAAGLPVLGSRLGGISEFVQHEINGLLVEPGCVRAWRGALRRICKEKELLPRLREGILPPPTMSDVASKMQTLYGHFRSGNAYS